MPCGHFSMCAQCLQAMREVDSAISEFNRIESLKQCPICRTSKIIIYFKLILEIFQFSKAIGKAEFNNMFQSSSDH
jgi:hypothetical protein